MKYTALCLLMTSTLAFADGIPAPGAPVALAAPPQASTPPRGNLDAQMLSELKAMRAVIARDQSAWGDPAALCFVNGKAFSEGAVFEGKRCEYTREAGAPLHWFPTHP